MTERKLGPWIVGKKLGRGGNAQVYIVRHEATGREAALKEINARKVDREPYKRFLVEIEVLRQLRKQPGVLPVLDDHIPGNPSTSDQPWLVMPIAQPLREVLVDADLRAVVVAIATIAQTMATLRRDLDIAHRDIKPSNLYELDGQTAVGDFGLVALPDRGDLTERGKPLGPANFMPFEMLNEPDTADAFCADVYSLAKTLWVLATGVDFPPPGHQPAEAAPYRIADNRPHPHARFLDELVDRATRLDPTDRPTMDEVASDLSAWLVLPTEQRDFDLSEAAAAVRRSLATQISETEKIERWKMGSQSAIRRFEEIVAPLNETLRTADPRAQIGKIDRFTDGWLKTLETMASPEVLLHWTRASMISAGSPLPYVLRLGRGIELIDGGELVIRAMVNVSLDGVMGNDVNWIAQERIVPVGTAQQEAALQEVAAELVEQLKKALQIYANNVVQH